MSVLICQSVVFQVADQTWGRWQVPKLHWNCNKFHQGEYWPELGECLEFCPLSRVATPFSVLHVSSQVEQMKKPSECCSSQLRQTISELGPDI